MFNERKDQQGLFWGLVLGMALSFYFCLFMGVEKIHAQKADLAAVDLRNVDIIDFLEVESAKGNVVNLAINSREKKPPQTLNGKTEMIEKRTTNHEFYPPDVNGKINHKVYLAPTYYEDGGEWYGIDYATTSPEEFDKLNAVSRFPVFLIIQETIAATFPIGAGDGYVQTSSKSWEKLRGAAQGTTDALSNTSEVYTSKGGSGTIYDYRSFNPADTSAISDDETIEEASFWFYPTTKWDDNGGYIALVETTQADPTTLSAGDYDAFTLTATPEFAPRLKISNITLNAWNHFTLDDFSLINKTGYTKAGVLSSFTIDNSAPPNPDDDNGVLWRSSEYTGTDYDPYFLATSSVAVVPTSTPTSTLPTFEATTTLNQTRSIVYQYDASGTLIGYETTITDIPIILLVLLLILGATLAFAFWLMIKILTI